jgi:TRAP-type mannitol/chloroaromatic compound transport system permease small subunit
MNFLMAVTRWIDALNRRVGRGVAWATLFLVIVIFTDVIMRYAFKTSFVFVQELEWHVFSFIFLMGAGFTLLTNGHVRVDIFYQQLSDRGQAWVNLLGVIFFLIPGCLMIIDTSAIFAYTAWTIRESSPDPGGIPLRFIVKSFIPLGFVLILLQGISLGIKSALTLLNTDPETGRNL